MHLSSLLMWVINHFVSFVETYDDPFIPNENHNKYWAMMINLPPNKRCSFLTSHNLTTRNDDRMDDMNVSYCCWHHFWEHFVTRKEFRHEIILLDSNWNVEFNLFYTLLSVIDSSKLIEIRSKGLKQVCIFNKVNFILMMSYRPIVMCILIQLSYYGPVTHECMNDLVVT